MVLKMLKKIIKPKNQYYYLCIPQLVFVIFVIYCLNLYAKTKNTTYFDGRKTPTLNISFIFPALVDIMIYAIISGLIPKIIAGFIAFDSNISKMLFDIYFYNFSSVLFGIYLIKKQEKLEKDV